MSFESGHFLIDGPDGPQYVDGGLKVARDVGAVPSITTVLKVVAKPALTNWIQSEAVKKTVAICEAITRDGLDPFGDKETLFEQVLTACNTKESADKGTAIHQIAQDYIERASLTSMDGMAESLSLLRAWIDDNLGEGKCEDILYSHTFEMGGRCDFHGMTKAGRSIVLDFKSQDVKPGKYPAYYPEFPMQLAFYDHCLGERGEVDLVSVIIGTNPCRQGVWTKTYSQEERARAIEGIRHARGLYRYLNKL